MARYEHSGNAQDAHLIGKLTATGLGLTIDGAAGWPTGSTGKFWVAIDPDTASEEHVLVNGRTGTALTVASIADRGLEGTAAVVHATGAVVRHSFSATEADASNAHINDTTLDQHTQYQRSDGVFNVARYGAVGDGTTNDTAAIQAAITAAVAAKGMLVIPPTSSYYKTVGALTVAGDLTVYAYGATIQIQGYIYNNTPINLRWYGGTITDAVGTVYPFQFGAGAGATAVTSRLQSCVARDLVFSQMHAGAWLCNAVDNVGANYNTDIYWDNVRCVKAAAANANDALQVVGDRVFVRATIDDGGTTGFGITSGWLKRAEWDVTAIGSGPRKIVALQPYNGVGSFPVFDNVTIEAHGGQLVLNNGDLSVFQTVATDTRIICDNVEWLEVGNTAFDGWGHVTAEGTIRLAGTYALAVVNCASFEGDLVIDGSGATGSNRELVALGNSPSSLCAHVKFKRLVVRQVAAASYTYVLGALPSSSCAQLSVLSGDVSDGVTSAFYPAADFASFGTFLVRGVSGYNPVGHAVTQPAVPASTVAATNTTGVDCTVFVTGGTVTVVAIGGTATGLTSGAFRVPAGQTIAVTYSVAPTWQWFGD